MARRHGWSKSQFEGTAAQGKKSSPAAVLGWRDPGLSLGETCPCPGSTSGWWQRLEQVVMVFQGGTSVGGSIRRTQYSAQTHVGSPAAPHCLSCPMLSRGPAPGSSCTPKRVPRKEQRLASGCCHCPLLPTVAWLPPPTTVPGQPSMGCWGAPRYLGCPEGPCECREVPLSPRQPPHWPVSSIPAWPCWPPQLCQPSLINHRLGLPAAYLLL